MDPERLNETATKVIFKQSKLLLAGEGQPLKEFQYFITVWS